MKSHVSSFFDYFNYNLLPYHSDIVKVIVIVKTEDVHFHQIVSTIHSALHWLLCHLWEPCRHSAILLIIIVILIVIYSRGIWPQYYLELNEKNRVKIPPERKYGDIGKNVGIENMQAS